MTSIKSNGGIDQMISMCRGLAAGMPPTVVQPIIHSHLSTQASKGETPEGDRWPLTVKGLAALRGAAAHYISRIIGNAIVFIVKAPDAYHHYGAQGKPVRRLLPLGTTPKRLGDAIRAGTVDWFKAKTTWGRRGYNYYAARGIKPMNTNGTRMAA